MTSSWDVLERKNGADQEFVPSVIAGNLPFYGQSIDVTANILSVVLSLLGQEYPGTVKIFIKVVIT